MEGEMPKENKLPVVPAYSPSWFDKLATWINRLPGPSWAAYFTLVLLLAGLGGIIQIIENPSMPVTFPPIVILVLFQIAYVLSLMAFLDKRAARALESFRPILKKQENLYLTLKNRLTTMPSRPILILTVLVLVFFSFMGAQIFSLPVAGSQDNELSVAMDEFTNTPFGFYSYIIFVLLWVINSLFIYHTFRQLKAINYAYTQCSEINLFRQNELYAFSTVSASTGIGLVLVSPIWLIIDPSVISLIINIAFAILAIIIFVTPLLGAHRLLKDQKDMLLINSLGKKEALITELYSRIENKDLTDIENYERALSSLEKAHNEIESISTWPWKMETVRQFIGALFLPIVIWMIQFSLAEILSN
jgi:hypothetical protein